MLRSSPDLPQKSFRIKQGLGDDKFFSRLMSKETANPSFRVYYGLSGAVPFVWESQPGTPKSTLSDTSLPPLTPPPSYNSKATAKPTKTNARSKLLHTLLSRINLKIAHLPSSRSSSSSLSNLSWSSFSHSSMSLPVTPSRTNRGSRSRSFSPRSAFDDRVDDDEKVGAFGSPTSTLRSGTVGRVLLVKKALLSMVGCGSA